MKDNLSQPSDQFILKNELQNLLKRSRFKQDQLPEIDFLEVQKQLTNLQQIQQRTNQQIVQFVDEHRNYFMDIHEELSQIEQKVAKSQFILKIMGNRIDEYKGMYYSKETQVQQFIDVYELGLIEKQVVRTVKDETAFLCRVNLAFEKITSREVSQLSHTQKYLLSRFCNKMKIFNLLFNHQIIRNYVPESLQISEMVTNFADQIQFYLSEQISKYHGDLLKFTNQDISEEDEEKLREIRQTLGLIKSWYISLGKKEEYLKVLQKNTIEKQLENGLKELVKNKTSLLSGRDAAILETLFMRIFVAMMNLPDDYPHQRSLNQVLSFFRKQEIKFLYTYAMPIFPLAYRSYMQAIKKSNLSKYFSQQLREKHGWNLKMWVTVRQKNIMDRSANDNDMMKWIEIIFKSNCMLDGTVSDFIKLGLKIVNRYLMKIKASDFMAGALNKLLEQEDKIGRSIEEKIVENMAECKELALKVRKSVEVEISQAIRTMISINLKMILVTCIGLLEPYKSFVTKIIRKDKEFVALNIVNKRQNVFRPIEGFLKTNDELTQKAVSFIRQHIKEELIIHYDKKYASQIYKYAKDELISEQLSLVMEVVGRERELLFNGKSL